MTEEIDQITSDDLEICIYCNSKALKHITSDNKPLGNNKAIVYIYFQCSKCKRFQVLEQEGKYDKDLNTVTAYNIKKYKVDKPIILEHKDRIAGFTIQFTLMDLMGISLPKMTSEFDKMVS